MLKILTEVAVTRSEANIVSGLLTDHFESSTADLDILAPLDLGRGGLWRVGEDQQEKDVYSRRNGKSLSDEWPVDL